MFRYLLVFYNALALVQGSVLLESRAFFVRSESAAAQSPILALAKGGRSQADVVAQAIFTAVSNRVFCIHISGFIQNLTDKMLSAGLSFIVYKKIKKWI